MSKEIKDIVKEKYAEIVGLDLSDNCSCNCINDFAFPDGSKDFSHDYTQLKGYSAEADYNLGCGTPTTFVSIKEGDTVVDLGSGAGNDAFVARSLVGESGRVIGIDMTQEMIDKAKTNNKKMSYDNVEFIFGEIEDIPLINNTADIVISNCVMNLVPDKEKAFSEVYRIMKPNGKFSISDIVISGELPEKLKESAELYVGCVAGAIKKEDYIDTIENTGFKNVNILAEKEYILPDTLVKGILSDDEFKLYKSSKANILSITVSAEK